MISSMLEYVWSSALLNRFADVAGVVVIRNQNGNERLRRQRAKLDGMQSGESFRFEMAMRGLGKKSIART